MKPIQTPETNAVYKLGGGDESNDLPVCRLDTEHGPAVRSTWALDTDDLAAVNRTGMIELVIVGEPIPPVGLSVLAAPDFVKMGGRDWKPPVTRSHLKRAIELLCSRLNDEGYPAAPAEDVIAGLEECLEATAGGVSGDGKPL